MGLIAHNFEFLLIAFNMTISTFANRSKLTVILHGTHVLAEGIYGPQEFITYQLVKKANTEFQDYLTPFISRV